MAATAAFLPGSEIAAAVRYLCGRGAGFITGQTLCVDGGQFTH